jgi:hypothetical protein
MNSNVNIPPDEQSDIENDKWKDTQNQTAAHAESVAVTSYSPGDVELQCWTAMAKRPDEGIVIECVLTIDGCVTMREEMPGERTEQLRKV